MFVLVRTLLVRIRHCVQLALFFALRMRIILAHENALYCVVSPETLFGAAVLVDRTRSDSLTEHRRRSPSTLPVALSAAKSSHVCPKRYQRWVNN